MRDDSRKSVALCWVKVANDMPEPYESPKQKAFARKTCEGFDMAEWTGLEPATPGVTGRYSNQLNYHSW